MEFGKERARALAGSLCLLLWGCLGMAGLSLVLQSVYQIPFGAVPTVITGALFFLSFSFLYNRKTFLAGALLIAAALGAVSYWIPGFWSNLPHCFSVLIADLFRRFDQTGMILLISPNYHETLRGLTAETLAANLQAAFVCLLLLSGAVMACCAYCRQRPFLLVFYVAALLFPYWTYAFAPSLFAARLLLAFLLSGFAVRLARREKALDTPRPRKKHLEKPNFLRQGALPRRAAAGFSALLVFVFVYGISFFSYLLPSAPWVDFSKAVDILLDLQLNLQAVSSDFPFRLNFSFGGGVSGGRVGGSFHPRNVPVMEIVTDSKTPVYLRAWVGRNYEQGGWSSWNQGDQARYQSNFEEEYYPESALQMIVGQYGKYRLSSWMDFSTVRIYNIRTGGSLMFLPSISYLAPEQCRDYGLEHWMDGMVYSGRQRLFDLDVTFEKATPLYQPDFYSFLDRFSGLESSDTARYRAYVGEQYLRVPRGLSAQLSALANEIAANETNDYGRAAAIQRYLASNYRYTTDPGDANLSDPVGHFLFESRQGYCSHYASAMVLLARSLGIPARYVEGYMVPAPQSANEPTIVMDSDAHAWPELYFAGVGWLPFEPTTGYSPHLMPSEGPVSSQPDSSSNPVSSRPAAPPGGIEDEPSSFPENQPPSNPSSTILEVPAPAVGENALPFIFIPLGLLLFAAAAGLGIFSLRCKRARRISFDDPAAVQKLAGFMMDQLERLGLTRGKGELPTDFAARVDARFRGVFQPSFQTCVGIILKDHFSASPTSKEERAQLFACANQLNSLLAAQSGPFKRFWRRHFSHLLGPNRS